MLDPLTQAFSGLKGRKLLCNYKLEVVFKELKCKVSDDNLLKYLEYKIPFTVHTDAYEKHVVTVISRNKLPIVLLFIIFRKPQNKYTTIEK